MNSLSMDQINDYFMAFTDPYRPRFGCCCIDWTWISTWWTEVRKYEIYFDVLHSPVEFVRMQI